MAIRKYKYTDWTFGSTNPNDADPLAVNPQSVTPDWAKRTPSEQERVDAANNAYAKYQAQVTENKKIANTPEATPGFGLYAPPAAVSPYNYGQPADEFSIQNQAKRHSLAITGTGDHTDDAWVARVAREQARADIPTAKRGYGEYADDEWIARVAREQARAQIPVVKSGNYGDHTDDEWVARIAREQARGLTPEQAQTPTAMPTSPYAGYTSPYEKQAQTTVADPFLYAKYTAPKTETAAVSGRATAPKTEVKKEAGVSTGNTGGASSTGSVGATESEYDKYYREQGYADREAQAEAEYVRSLHNYGVQAEQLAQAGIHGGYGEYLDSVAYAQMQSAKEGIAKEAREGYAAYANGVNKDLYTLLTRGSYTDADGNTVQGYTLLDMTDDQYEASKESIKKDLNGLGYSPADIEATFAQVDAVRGTNKADTATRTKTALDSYIKGTTDANKFLEDLGVTDSQIAAATEQYVEQYKQEHGEEISAEEARDAVVGSAIIQTIDDARKNGLLGEGDAGLKVESDFIRKRLPMYGEEYNATGWKDRGETLADSIEDALDYKEAGMMTEQDVKAVINDALGKMFGDKKQEVQYVNTGNSVKMTIVNDKGESEMLKADFDGKATDSAAAWLNHNCANCPIAVYDGQLYYKAYEHGNWMKLRTKGGITPGFNRGTPDQGDQYFKVVAYAMMQNNDYPAYEDKDKTYDLKVK